jgi:hypothetical protein
MKMGVGQWREVRGQCCSGAKKEGRSSQSAPLRVRFAGFFPALCLLIPHLRLAYSCFLFIASCFV